jgi:hypothetical protein
MNWVKDQERKIRERNEHPIRPSGYTCRSYFGEDYLRKLLSIAEPSIDGRVIGLMGVSPYDGLPTNSIGLFIARKNCIDLS